MAADQLIDCILYRDAHVLALNKPPGMAVHRGPRTPRSLEDHLPALRFGFHALPQPAHRLDRDTSGCLVLGRHARALRRLGRLFAEGRIAKVYWAVVRGDPPDHTVIDRAIAKRSDRSGWRMVVDPGGQPAVTELEVLGRASGTAWVALRPRTGRTHQLRMHCAAAGWPILCDAAYGWPALPESGLHLHARGLSIPYSEARPPIEVEAPPPGHMTAALHACGYSASVTRSR